MIQIAIKALNVIGDQSNLFTYKLIAIFGFSGIGITATANVAGVATPPNDDISIAVIASIVSIISGILFIMQRAYTMYLDYQKNKRETEAHEREMSKEE